MTDFIPFFKSEFNRMDSSDPENAIGNRKKKSGTLVFRIFARFKLY